MDCQYLILSLSNLFSLYSRNVPLKRTAEYITLLKTINCFHCSHNKRKTKLSMWPARLPPWQLLMPFLLVLSPPAILPLSASYKLLFLLADGPLPMLFSSSGISFSSLFAYWTPLNFPSINSNFNSLNEA